MHFARLTLPLLAFIGSNAWGADKVDQFMQKEMARSHIPGAAVAVVQNGKVVKLAAYGTADLENKQAASAGTAFQIASATKMFTGVVLMQLVGEGKIELDAPVSRYLADTPGKWSAMTVRQLANHTAGLPPGPMPAEIDSTAKAVEVAKKQSMLAKPGELSQYGSLDFSVLAAIVEKAGGAPVEDLIAQRIAKPLGMSATRFDPPANPAGSTVVHLPGRAVTYEWKAGSQQAYRFPYHGYTYAAGGALASIADMSKFMQAMMRDAPLGAAQKETMWEPALLNNGKRGGFAIGWTVSTFRGEREVGHSGGPALSDVVYYPARKLAVVVLTNQRTLVPNLAHAIASQYLPAPSFINEPSIADEAPDLNARLIVAVNDLADGKAGPARFAGKAREELADLNAVMPLQLGGLPPMTRLVLLSDSPDHRRRVYRAVYGKDQSLRWTVSFDQDRRITDIASAEE